MKKHSNYLNLFLLFSMPLVSYNALSNDNLTIRYEPGIRTTSLKIDDGSFKTGQTLMGTDGALYISNLHSAPVVFKFKDGKLTKFEAPEQSSEGRNQLLFNHQRSKIDISEDGSFYYTGVVTKNNHIPFLKIYRGTPQDESLHEIFSEKCLGNGRGDDDSCIFSQDPLVSNVTNQLYTVIRNDGKNKLLGIDVTSGKVSSQVVLSDSANEKIQNAILNPDETKLYLHGTKKGYLVDLKTNKIREDMLKNDLKTSHNLISDHQGNIYGVTDNNLFKLTPFKNNENDFLIKTWSKQVGFKGEKIYLTPDEKTIYVQGKTSVSSFDKETGHSIKSRESSLSHPVSDVVFSSDNEAYIYYRSNTTALVRPFNDYNHPRFFAYIKESMQQLPPGMHNLNKDFIIVTNNHIIGYSENSFKLPDSEGESEHQGILEDAESRRNDTSTECHMLCNW